MASEQNLYVMKYRGGIAGVQTAWVKASDLQMAELVGRTWCQQEPTRQFVTVSKAVVADESILEKLNKEELDDVLARSTGTTPRETPVIKIPLTR